MALKTFLYGEAAMKNGERKGCAVRHSHTCKQQRRETSGETNSDRHNKEKGRIIPGKRGLALCDLLLQRNMVEYCYSYLLPVKYESFRHVIPILIFLEEFTAWRRRQSYSISYPGQKAAETYSWPPSTLGARELGSDTLTQLLLWWSWAG